MFDVNEVVGELQGLREEGYLSDALLRRAVRSIFGSEDRFDWVGVYVWGLSNDDYSWSFSEMCCGPNSRWCFVSGVVWKSKNGKSSWSCFGSFKRCSFRGWSFGSVGHRRLTAYAVCNVKNTFQHI